MHVHARVFRGAAESAKPAAAGPVEPAAAESAAPSAERRRDPTTARVRAALVKPGWRASVSKFDKEGIGTVKLGKE